MSTYQGQSRRNARHAPEPSASLFGLRNILRNGWLFASVSLLTALAGITYALTLTPVYEGNTLIQINRNANLAGDVQEDVPASTEVEILRSRSIVSRVVDALQLDISVEPKLFPVLGAYMTRTGKTLSEPGLFGRGGYVWGAEQVRVRVFTVPDPLLRQPFTLTAGAGNTFTLTQKDTGIRLAGRVGEQRRASTRYGDVEVLVSEIHARPGAEFVLVRNPKFQVVEQLRKSLSITENGKQSNVIGVSLKGSNPELISRILNQIGHEYISQHVAQKSGEANRALTFYDQQLAESRERLQKLDERLAQALRVRGIADLNEESATLSQQAIALQAKMAEAERQKIELSSRFLENHPAVIVVTRHIADLNRDLDRIEARRKLLAAAQQEIAILTRERQASNEINMGLLNSRQKLAAVMSSEIRDARVVDRAETPVQPVTLRMPVMIVLACLAGLVLGALASLLKNALVGRNSPVELPSQERPVRLHDITVEG